MSTVTIVPYSQVGAVGLSSTTASKHTLQAYPIASYPALAYHCGPRDYAIGVEFLIQPMATLPRWIPMGD